MNKKNLGDKNIIALNQQLLGTARPRDTRILVPEKNRAAQNRAS